MRCVCFMPSEPVMPWTRILLFSLRKIAMSVSSSLLRRGELSGAASRTVHGVEAVGHDLRRGAATDVEEVRGLDAAELLTGVGDDVEGAHDQARAVADDADLALELDVVEVLLLGRRLQRVG